MSVFAEKQALRRHIREVRAALDPALRSRHSDDASRHLLAVRAPRPSDGAWSLFAALPDEIDPSPLARAAETAGLATLYPRVERGELTFVPGRLDALVAGHFGVREPVGPGVPLETARVVVVPGLAFDGRGGRLGYGRGYYDRAIRAARLGPQPPLFVALAFDVQRVDAVPITEDDQPLDALVTERGWLWFRDRPV